jgi:hypothetical protein
MNKTLLENNYLVIPNFISKERSKELSEEFVNHSKTANFHSDPQAPNSFASYNYISFLELLCEKTPRVSESVGETVLPTYSYARVYGNQDKLIPHCDREECEISITLHLDGDQPWHIWVKTKKGEDKGIVLNPGDAMVYLGSEGLHWRNPYQGDRYVQVFLHYVQSRGKYSEYYFDKSKGSLIDGLTSKVEDSSIVETKTEDSQLEKVKTPSVIVKPSSTLEEFIVVLDDIVPIDLCDKILLEYSNSDDWTKTAVGKGEYVPEIRSCETITLSTNNIINKNFDVRKEIDDSLFRCANNCLKQYLEKFPNLSAETDTGYELLRYQKGQKYTQHTDSFINQQRSITCSLLLNEDYEGGEFGFFDREILIKGGKGSAIMFPSNFMYPHEILEVISGTRYSIITWYV